MQRLLSLDAQIDPLEYMHMLIKQVNATEGQEELEGLSALTRLAALQSLCLQEQLGASTRRLVLSGHNPRPAGLGEAGRHATGMIGVHLCYKLHQPPYLLTRQATQDEPTLQAYKRQPTPPFKTHHPWREEES
jgi:hypothetical protein